MFFTDEVPKLNSNDFEIAFIYLFIDFSDLI